MKGIFFLGVVVLFASGSVALAAAEPEPAYAWVTVAVEVDENGRSSSATVLESVPDGRFDEAALAAVAEAEYPIRKVDGKAIAYRGEQTIEIPRPEPESHSHKLAQVDALIRTCRYDYAEQVLELPPLPSSKDESAEQSVRFVEIDLLNERFELALERLDELLEQVPESSQPGYEFRVQRLWALLKLNRPAQAVADAEVYLDEVPIPENFEIHKLLAVALAEAERYDAALERLLVYLNGPRVEQRPGPHWVRARAKRELTSYVTDTDLALKAALTEAVESPAQAESQLMDWIALAFPNSAPHLSLQITGLRPLSRVAPDYPRRALSRNLQGRVVVLVKVDAAGRVSEATIEHADPVGVFDDAALEAIRQWRFYPKYENCRAVAHEGLQPLDFTLR